MSNYKLSLEKQNVVSELEVNRANIILGNGNTEAIWGTIQGDIDNQLDLIEKLDSISESIPDISLLATKEEVDTKANKIDVYTKEEIDNKGFLTEHQSLEDYALKTDIPDISNLAAKDEVAFKIDVYTKTEVDEKISSGGSFDSSLYYDKTSVDTLLDDKANISDIPTNTSQLVNDSGFITNIPDEYITNSELEAKGYLTEHQDISNLATKAELATKADTSSLDGKVDKVEGKSLIDDTEIARLATVTNYDDTEVKNQIATKANSADVYTKTEIDNMIGTISSTLDTLNGEVV